MKRLFLTFLFSLVLFQIPLKAESHPVPFQWKETERIVFVGGTSVEVAIQHNYLESILTSHYSNKNFTFRNLGWSGDNVLGHSRTVFQPLSKGFEILVRQIQEQKPSTVLLSYGMVESFEGSQALDTFIGNYKRLLDKIKEMGARAVLISPIHHEDLGPPLPNPKKHNENLLIYVEALQKLADERKLKFVNLFEATKNLNQSQRKTGITTNGIHPNDYGYWLISQIIAKNLGVQFPKFNLEIDTTQGLHVKLDGLTISELKAVGSNLQFKTEDRAIPLPLPKVDFAHELHPRKIVIKGLKEGKYQLMVDGEKVAEGTAKAWSNGAVMVQDSGLKQAANLKQTITKKNELFFHRWRPQNETYLFLFRKHEQGNNAKEVKMFDPLIEKEEKKINKLKVPFKATYELIHIGEEVKP